MSSHDSSAAVHSACLVFSDSFNSAPFEEPLIFFLNANVTRANFLSIVSHCVGFPPLSLWSSFPATSSPSVQVQIPGSVSQLILIVILRRRGLPLARTPRLIIQNLVNVNWEDAMTLCPLWPGNPYRLPASPRHVNVSCINIQHWHSTLTDTRLPQHKVFLSSFNL